MRFPFVKMHGTRNDFIVLDTRERSLGDLAGFARRACDRHSGIGADGVLAIESSAVADAKMRVINADGGEAEMCGNGIRCVARYLVESGASNLLRIETIGGIHSCETIVASGDWSVRVAIGEVTIERRALPFPDASAVVVGNPHVVLFADRLDAFDLREAQELLTREAGYVDGVNVHLAVVERDFVRVLHYERGAAATQACGTGAVAVAAAVRLRNSLPMPVRLEVPGGTLWVEFDKRGEATLIGPAVRVYEGEIDVEFA